MWQCNWCLIYTENNQLINKTFVILPVSVSDKQNIGKLINVCIWWYHGDLIKYGIFEITKITS